MKRSSTRAFWKLVAMALTGMATAAGTLAVTAIAASAQTDTVYVNVPTTLDEPLPAGTPDVATPLSSELMSACSSVGPVTPLPSEGAEPSAVGVCQRVGSFYYVVEAANVAAGASDYCGVGVLSHRRRLPFGVCPAVDSTGGSEAPRSSGTRGYRSQRIVCAPGRNV
jgi:hypothetical protein